MRARIAAMGFAMLASVAHGATPMVAAGNSHAMALHADGTVRTWGDDSRGQLGLGRTLAAPAPAPVVGINDAVQVASGENHVVALRRDGTVVAWGVNRLGQLGDGSTTSRSLPAAVTGLAGITQVSSRGGSSLALRGDGTVWSWGENYNGELGYDEAQLVPQQVPGLPRIQMVSSGGQHGMALDTAGGVWTWGRGTEGQLGDGTSANRTAPRRLEGLPAMRAVIAGSVHSLAIAADTGAVYSWGSNYDGQVGNGSPNDQPVPVQLPGLANVTRISAGVFHTLALMADGTMRAWGSGYSGELGDGEHTPSETPIAIPGFSGVTDVAAGAFFSVARKSDGSVWTWGGNGSGQIADGTTDQRSEPYRVASLPPVESIAAAGSHAFAVTADGRVFAWGSNEYGELGDGARPLRTTPGIVPDATSVIRIAAGGDHSLAVRADGTVLAWGGNGLGQLGEDSGQPRSRAAAVPGLAGIRDVSAGYYFSVALGNDGGVWTWGYNYGGQLGRGEGFTTSAAPTRLANLPVITAISSGGSHTLALTTGGTIVGWGGNGAGQLGDGTTTDRYSPVAVPGLVNVVAVAAGGSHSLALGSDGRVYAWGLNYSGELGDGTNDDRRTPAVVPGLSDVVGIGAGSSFSFAVTRDGRVYAWGANWGSQLGDGSGLSQSSPVQVARVRGIRAISGGGGGGLALKSDGTVYAWGDNIDGRVGDGTFVARDLPVLVLREDGAGTLEGNDWFLDLDPSAPNAIADDSVPAFLVVAQRGAGDVSARVQFRAGDVGSSGSVFVFALAPATSLPGAAAAKDARIAVKARGAEKDSVPCQLAQLNSQGQLVAVSAASLQAYVSGVLSSQGQSVKVLENTNPGIAGATFYVGYGPNGDAMLTNGTTRSVVSVPGSVSCRPQAPQTGWWFNPAEGGRGFSIEARGNRLFMAAFHYEPDGRATWNFAGGVTSLDGSLFTADFLSASGGQTLTGAYRFPNLANAGSITFAFSDAQHGTLVWPGGTVPIERQASVPNGLTLPPQPGLPEGGWWWNPDESGRGFFIEWQGGFVNIAGYMYDAQGRPTWYITVVPTPDPLRITSTWWTYANGQAMGQPYRSPTRTSDNAGTLDVRFTSATTATMTLPDGRQIPLVRQAF